MEKQNETQQRSLNWTEIWWIALLHPNTKSHSTIINDPKAGLKWGIIWSAITSTLIWFVNPLREVWVGLINNNFGFQTASIFKILGAVASPIIGILTLLFFAAFAHNFTRLFGGQGKVKILVYAWAVIQFPFFILIGLARLIPYLLPASRGYPFSATDIILQFVPLAIMSLVLLYLLYVQIVAFSAVEGFSIGKGLGILVLITLVISILGVILGYGVREFLLNQGPYIGY